MSSPLVHSAPTRVYHSRPDIIAPVINISVLDRSRICPGYWFLTFAESWIQPGPYIYDNEGSLIWSGVDKATGQLVTDLKVVEVSGETQLSLFRGNRQGMYAAGAGVILDNRYHVKSSIGVQETGFDPDEHEFNIIDHGRKALMASYQPKRYDLARFNFTTGIGWVLDSSFYEVDLQTNTISYSWSALDHVDLMESQLPVLEIEDSGSKPDNGWDFFHINSVDETLDGNFLVSSRHTCTIFKISRADGTVMWRLGGPRSSFQMDPNLTFYYQHHAKIISENETMAIISLFDNGAGSWPKAIRLSPRSRSLIIALDFSSSPMTARLLSSFEHPTGQTAIAKGSVQDLPNGNTLVGWGQAGGLSEVTPDGDLVLHSKFGPGVTSYRAYKFKFTATPEELPILWTYSLDHSSPSVFYVSWNGATEVHFWNFYACDHTGTTNSGTRLGSEAKTGFETIHRSSQKYEWTFAEAVSVEGKSLANSTCTATFVPSSELRPHCRPEECYNPIIDLTQSSSALTLVAQESSQLGTLLLLGSGIVLSLLFLWRSGVGSMIRSGRFRWQGFHRLIAEID